MRRNGRIRLETQYQIINISFILLCTLLKGLVGERFKNAHLITGPKRIRCINNDSGLSLARSLWTKMRVN